MFHGFHGVSKDRYNITSDDLFCPLLDARRMEVYSAVFNSEGKALRNIRLK